MLDLVLSRKPWSGQVADTAVRICEGFDRPVRIKSVAYKLSEVGGVAACPVLFLQDPSGVEIGRWFSLLAGGYPLAAGNPGGVLFDCCPSESQLFGENTVLEGRVCVHVTIPTDLILLPNYRLYVANEAGDAAMVPEGEIICQVVVPL